VCTTGLIPCFFKLDIEQEFITVRVCNCHMVSTTAISQYDVGNQW